MKTENNFLIFKKIHIIWCLLYDLLQNKLIREKKILLNSHFSYKIKIIILIPNI